MTDKEADDADVDEGQRRRYFRRDNGKVNLTPPAENADWYYLASVDLDNSLDDALAKGDNVGVVTAWEFPLVELPPMTPQRILKLWSVMDGKRWREDVRSKKEPWIGTAIAEVLDLGEDLKRPQRRDLAKVVKTGIGAKWLRVVEDKDDEGKSRNYVQAGQMPKVTAS
jgi:hypothetical protein